MRLTRQKRFQPPAGWLGYKRLRFKRPRGPPSTPITIEPLSRQSSGSIGEASLSTVAGLPSVGGKIGSRRFAIQRRMVRSVIPTSWHGSGVEYSSCDKGLLLKGGIEEIRGSTATGTGDWDMHGFRSRHRTAVRPMSSIRRFWRGI